LINGTGPHAKSGQHAATPLCDVSPGQDGQGGGGYGAGGGGVGNGAGDGSGGGDGAAGMVYVEWQNSNDFVAQADQNLTGFVHRSTQGGG
jgi:hypothetical protein